MQSMQYIYSGGTQSQVESDNDSSSGLLIDSESAIMFLSTLNTVQRDS